MVLTWAQILMILIIRVSNRRLVQRTEPIGKLPVQKDDAPEGWSTDWLVMPEDTPVHFLCYKGTGWHSPMSHEASRNQSLWEVGSCVWTAQDPRNLSWWSLSVAAPLSVFLLWSPGPHIVLSVPASPLPQGCTHSLWLLALITHWLPREMGIISLVSALFSDSPVATTTFIFLGYYYFEL